MIILGEKERILCCLVCGCGRKAFARHKYVCFLVAQHFCRRGVFSAAIFSMVINAFLLFT